MEDEKVKGHKKLVGFLSGAPVAFTQAEELMSLEGIDGVSGLHYTASLLRGNSLRV